MTKLRSDKIWKLEHQWGMDKPEIQNWKNKHWKNYRFIKRLKNTSGTHVFYIIK